MGRPRPQEPGAPSMPLKLDVVRSEVAGPYCRVEGCTAETATEKVYYRRYRICEHHMKKLALLVDGRPMRFCQQCAKLHDVSEFDATRRSCREKLKCHSARRRVQVNRAGRCQRTASDDDGAGLLTNELAEDGGMDFDEDIMVLDGRPPSCSDLTTELGTRSNSLSNSQGQLQLQPQHWGATATATPSRQSPHTSLDRPTASVSGNSSPLPSRELCLLEANYQLGAGGSGGAGAGAGGTGTGTDWLGDGAGLAVGAGRRFASRTLHSYAGTGAGDGSQRQSMAVSALGSTPNLGLGLQTASTAPARLTHPRVLAGLPRPREQVEQPSSQRLCAAFLEQLQLQGAGGGGARAAVPAGLTHGPPPSTLLAQLRQQLGGLAGELQQDDNQQLSPGPGARLDLGLGQHSGPMLRFVSSSTAAQRLQQQQAGLLCDMLGASSASSQLLHSVSLPQVTARVGRAVAPAVEAMLDELESEVLQGGIMWGQTAEEACGMAQAEELQVALLRQVRAAQAQREQKAVMDTELWQQQQQQLLLQRQQQQQQLLQTLHGQQQKLDQQVLQLQQLSSLHAATAVAGPGQAACAGPMQSSRAMNVPNGLDPDLGRALGWGLQSPAVPTGLDTRSASTSGASVMTTAAARELWTAPTTAVADSDLPALLQQGSGGSQLSAADGAPASRSWPPGQQNLALALASDRTLLDMYINTPDGSSLEARSAAVGWDDGMLLGGSWVGSFAGGGKGPGGAAPGKRSLSSMLQDGDVGRGLVRAAGAGGSGGSAAPSRLAPETRSSSWGPSG